MEDQPASPYQRLNLWYFSGTGNSYRAAQWLQQEAEAAGLKCDLNSIQVPFSPVQIEDPAHTLVGIIAPSHAFCSPWLVFRFLRHLPRVENGYAFCLATRAGIKVGPLFPPGINGSGNFLVSLALWLKGYRVHGARSVDMPCNWIAVHPGIKDKNAQAIIDRAEPKVRRFGQTVLNGDTHWLTVNNAYELIWGLLLFPITVLYLLIGRFFLAKIFFADSRCNACQLCVNHCPVGALRIKPGKHPRPFWRYTCESCMRCMAICPEEAIQASHSWVIALWMMVSIPMTAYALSWLSRLMPNFSESLSFWLHHGLNLLWHYLVIFCSYYAFYYAGRLFLPNLLLRYSTLTTFFRRYHVPGMKLGEMKRKAK